MKFEWMRLAVGIWLIGTTCISAQTPAEKVERLLDELRLPGVIQTSIGVTRTGTPIPALTTKDDLDYFTPKTRVLLVGGLDGSEASVLATLNALRWFYLDDEAKPNRDKVALSVVPVANPDGWALGVGPSNGSGGHPTTGYPPEGTAYNSATDPEAAYLWRWIGMHVPDWVIELRSADKDSIGVPRIDDQTSPSEFTHIGVKFHVLEADQLAQALFYSSPSGIASTSAVQYLLHTQDAKHLMRDWGVGVDDQTGLFPVPSYARQAIQQRLKRTPIEISEQLAQHYGHKLDQVAYIPALALVGRIRLADLSGDSSHLTDVEQITKPYFDGTKPTLPERTSGSNLSGHLVFSELAHVTKKDRYIELAKVASDLGFDDQGNPNESMPFHNEMSDAFFMGIPILAEVGQLTANPKYFDMALRHMKFMQNLCLRPDNIYRHSPLNEVAWGRGNGFPALGLALSLSAMPADHPDRADMLHAFRNHLEALTQHQDPTGMWHQVIDHPESYRELTATSMITFAMLRGMRSGWLDRDIYEPVADRAWEALKTRIAPSGELVDVCTGTGKQKTLRDYFDRTAILGHDDRGGAMALMVSTEMAYWRRER